MRPVVPSRVLRIRVVTWAALFAGMTAACLFVAAGRPAGDGEREPPPLAAEHVPWPPDMRVAPPPPDAPPPDFWPRLEVRVRDPGGALVPGAAVQVWVDGRGCIDRSFGNDHFKRPDVIESPDGRNTWLSAATFTGPDGVANLRVPTGAGTHLVARDARGRTVVMRFDSLDSCMTPCVYFGDCGTCTEGAPCIQRRSVTDCSELRHLDLTLVDPVRLSGRVVDEHGRPVAGARVMPTPRLENRWFTRLSSDPWPDGSLAIDEWSRVSWGAPQERPVLTDRMGRFAMQVAERGPMRLVVVGERHLVSWQDIDVAGQRVYANLRTARATRLVIRVVDDAGHPVAGASVHFDGSREATTDAAGRLVVNGMFRGLITVWVQADGYAPREIAMFAGDREMLIPLEVVPHVRVDLSAPPDILASIGDRGLVDVRLLSAADPPGSSWSGERTGSAEMAPDGSGQAVIEKVPPGDYTVWASWRGGLVRGPVVRVQDETPVAVRVRLGGDSSLAGAIRERVDGRLRDVRWYLDLWLMDETRRIAAPALVENGRYGFVVLPPGRWRLETHRSRRIDVRPGRNRRDLIIRPERRL